MKPLDLTTVERPDASLLTYYALRSLAFGPLFPVLLIPLFFRYHTLAYRFDDDGISMRWGILFRREIHLTYARIQDIHLVSNVVERWLGLARIQIQTASGSAKAEMTIEGVERFEEVRDWIYARMRGARSDKIGGDGATGPSETIPVEGDELADLLRRVAEELRGVREAIERHGERDRG